MLLQYLREGVEEGREQTRMDHETILKEAAISRIVVSRAPSWLSEQA